MLDVMSLTSILLCIDMHVQQKLMHYDHISLLLFELQLCDCSLSDVESVGIRFPDRGQVAALLNVKFHQTKLMQMTPAANAHRASLFNTHIHFAGEGK